MLKISKSYFFFLISLFVLLEIIVRLAFPEFTENDIYYKKNKNHFISKGKDNYIKRIGSVPFRVSELDEDIIFNNNKSIWFLGDSVTNGYGVNFDDIYHSILKKKINEDINIYNSSAYNSNFFQNKTDLNNTIIKFIKKKDIVIYQFNFNDIIDIARETSIENKSNNLNKKVVTNKDKSNNFFLSDKDLPEKRKLDQFIISTHKFRNRYLNHSSFLKLLQHYASIAVKKTTGTCDERGLDALGPYTYSYFAKNYENKSQILWDIFLDNLVITKRELDKLDVKFLVLVVPISLEVYGHEKINKLNYNLDCATKNGHQYLLKILKENKIPFIDVLPFFNSYSKKQKKNKNLLFHTYDTNHPNERGHEIISNAIFEKSKIIF